MPSGFNLKPIYRYALKPEIGQIVSFKPNQWFESLINVCDSTILLSFMLYPVPSIQPHPCYLPNRPVYPR